MGLGYAMTIKIPLLVRGLDLRDAEAYLRIDPDLMELSWKSNGGVTLAVVYTDAGAPVVEAADWARRITKLMPGVSVVNVHDELVSVADIAMRASVAPEAVRLWATGKRRATGTPFPTPRQVVGTESGGKSMNLYAWREVLSWVREVVGIDADEGIDYLTDRQLAELNAELVGQYPLEHDAWTPLRVPALRCDGRARVTPSQNVATAQAWAPFATAVTA